MSEMPTPFYDGPYMAWPRPVSSNGMEGTAALGSVGPEVPSRDYATLEDVSRVVGDIQWAIRDWLPRGFMNVVFGRPEHGKSSLVLQTARHLLFGEPWPDGTPCQRVEKVVWIETEASEAGDARAGLVVAGVAAFAYIRRATACLQAVWRRRSWIVESPVVDSKRSMGSGTACKQAVAHEAVVVRSANETLRSRSDRRQTHLPFSGPANTALGFVRRQPL